MASLEISDEQWNQLSKHRDLLKRLFDVDITLTTRSSGSQSNDSPTHCDSGICFSGNENTTQSLNKVDNESSSESYASSRTTAEVEDSKSKRHFLFLDTQGPQENLEKALKFAYACMPSDEMYNVCTQALNDPEDFQLISCKSLDIQKSSASLLELNTDLKEITFHGLETSISSAKAMVAEILERSTTIQDFTSTLQNSVDSKESELCVGSPLTEGKSKTDLVEICDRVQGLFPTSSNEECIGLYTSKSAFNADDDTNFAQGLESSFENTTSKDRLRENLSLSSTTSEKSDDLHYAPDVLTDVRYSKQVSQAVKLGYSEEHAKAALIIKGPDCDLNGLLAELVRSHDSYSSTLSSSECLPDSGLRLSPPPLLSGPREEESSLLHDTKNSDKEENLRHIIIDGSNVAMGHGQSVFSCKGIKIAVKWFKERGHKEITVFVPQWRKETSRPDAPITDQDILMELEKERIVAFTPARRVKGRRVVCYDDRYILKLAAETDGIVVSNDIYRDLVNNNEQFRTVVDERLLMFTFVNDRFMPPEDPLGRLGPSLDDFLRKVPAEPPARPQECPYDKKCTYGNKCKFYHPERGFMPQKSISETIKERNNVKLQEIATKASEASQDRVKRTKQKLIRTRSLIPGEIPPTPPATDSNCKKRKPKLGHSKSVSGELLKTEDYLTESRKKLEQAEELDGKMAEKSENEKYVSIDSQKKVSMSGASIGLQSQNSMPMLYTSVNPTGLNSFPAPVGHSVSTTSPTHLTVTSRDPEERRVSEHTLVAKKLSDDGNDKVFFSERTTSPSLSGSVNSAKSKQQKENLGGSEKLRTDSGEEFVSGTILPNLSVFDINNSESRSPNLSPRHESFSSGKVSPHLPVSSPATTNLDTPTNLKQASRFCSYPQTSDSTLRLSPQMRRASYSFETVNSKNAHIASKSANVHHFANNLSKHEHFYPGPSAQQLHPSPESQLSPTTPSMVAFHNNYTGGMSTDGTRSYNYISTNHQLHHNQKDYRSVPFQQPPSFPVMYGKGTQQTLPVGLHLPIGQPPERATYSSYQSPTLGGDPNQSMPFSPNFNQQMFLSPPPQPMYQQSPHFPPPYQPNMPGQDLVHQGMFYSPTPCQSYSPHVPNQFTHQSHHMPMAGSYSSPDTYNNYNMNPTGQPLSQGLDHGAARSMHLFLSDEDVPIMPPDPRYNLYNNLINLFDEKLVRNVMNRHPNETDSDNLCALILTLKKNAGK